MTSARTPEPPNDSEPSDDSEPPDDSEQAHSAGSSPPDPPSPPEFVGPYRIVRVLGEGGMGVVYEAEQTEPMKRRVALKLIRGALATSDVVTRFEAERQALAVMEHPNIAKVFDAGTTGGGQPYFVMEFVDGLPLNEFADEHRLSTEDRIHLFIPVCEAIQHAHQKGVIHRDLKPSNVLVSDLDGRPTPRVIDFGVAKAMGVKLTDKTLATEYGAVVGTPAYMSPEQAEGTGLDVDTRSDIYSLGVMLYELLMGRLPVDPTELGIIPFLAQLLAGDTNPPTPSDRLEGLASDAAELAERRRTDAPGLKRALRGDLDWIVMKAIAPEPDRRYETTNALALDLARYLNDEPVRARPPSTRYRLGKFVRRNKAAVAGAAAAVLLLVAGTVATSVGMVRARQAEARATEEAATATQVAGFMESLFETADPSRTQGREVTIGDVLDDAATRIDQELEGQAPVQARLMNVISRAYYYLGRGEDSHRLNQARHRLLEEAYGPIHPEVAVATNAVGFTERDLDRKVQYLERSIEIWEALGSPEGRGGIAANSAILAYTYASLDRIEEGEAAGRRAVEILETYPDPDRERWELGGRTPSEVLLAAYINLGLTLYLQARLDETLVVQGRSLALAEGALGPEHPDLSRHLANYGGLLVIVGRLSEAGSVLKRGLELRERRLPTRDGISRQLFINLGTVRWKQGALDDADSLIAVARSIYDEPSLAGLQGHIRMARGELQAAETFYREALAGQERQAGSDDRGLGPPLTDLGWALIDQGRYAEARNVCERAAGLYEAAEPMLVEHRYHTAGRGRERIGVWASRATACLATAVAALGDAEEGEALFRQALATGEAMHAEAPDLVGRRDDLVVTLRRFAAFLRAQERPDEAAQLEARLTDLAN